MFLDFEFQAKRWYAIAKTLKPFSQDKMEAEKTARRYYALWMAQKARVEADYGREY